jgi:hypothetical protein
MAFRDAVTFEVAVAGLCQSSAGLAPTLGNRSNDTDKMKESVWSSQRPLSRRSLVPRE